MIEGIIPGIFI